MFRILVLFASLSFGQLKAIDTNGYIYSLGAGATVVQLTSRTTGVTINKITGQITTAVTSLAAGASAVFTVTNSKVALHDVIVLSVQAGTIGGNTNVTISGVGIGTFNIRVSNNSAAGGVAETGAIVLSYIVLKGAST